MRLFNKVLVIAAILFAMLIAIDARAEVKPYEVQLPIMCGDTSNLIEGLEEKYDEEVVFMAGGKNNTGDELYHSLWINYGTKTWSFIVVNKQRNTTCVISSGDNFTMFFPSNGT
jgi:hypothetical protein